MDLYQDDESFILSHSDHELLRIMEDSMFMLQPSYFQSQPFFGNLPPEIIEQILSYLDMKTLACVSSTCKYLNGFVNERDNTLWRKLALEFSPELRADTQTWKNTLQNAVMDQGIIRILQYPSYARYSIKDNVLFGPYGVCTLGNLEDGSVFIMKMNHFKVQKNENIIRVSSGTVYAQYQEGAISSHKGPFSFTSSSDQLYCKAVGMMRSKSFTMNGSCDPIFILIAIVYESVY